MAKGSQRESAGVSAWPKDVVCSGGGNYSTWPGMVGTPVGRGGRGSREAQWPG